MVSERFLTPLSIQHMKTEFHRTWPTRHVVMDGFFDDFEDVYGADAKEQDLLSEEIRKAMAQITGLPLNRATTTRGTVKPGTALMLSNMARKDEVYWTRLAAWLFLEGSSIPSVRTEEAEGFWEVWLESYGDYHLHHWIPPVQNRIFIAEVNPNIFHGVSPIKEGGEPLPYIQCVYESLEAPPWMMDGGQAKIVERPNE